MKLRLNAWLCLGMVVAGCDKREPPASPAGENPTPPRVTRTARPPLRQTPDEKKNLRAALTSAGEIEAPTEREKAIEKLAWDALELDPELAREAMEQLPPDGAGRIRLIQHLAMRMAEQNVDHALSWANTLTTDHEHAAAVGHIALVLSDTEPERAATLLSEFGIAGRGFDVVAVQVLNRWAVQAPADAAAWVAAFPPGKARVAGILTVVSTWAKDDPEAVFSWMATVRDESVREESTLAMAEALLRQPENVREESLGHADPNVRGEIEARWDAAKKEAGHDNRLPSH